MTRSVLLATCVVAHDARVDVGALLALWRREAAVPDFAIARDDAGSATAAVIDDLDQQSFLLAAARGTRPGLAIGCHLGARVNGRGDGDPLALSERSRFAARQLARAAGDGEILLSADLGAFLSIARARVAHNLEAARVRVGGSPETDAFRLRLAATPGPAPAQTPVVRNTGNGVPAPATPPESGRRAWFIEQLASALVPFLGPIAPLLLEQLPAGRLSAQQVIDVVTRDVPPAQRDDVRHVIEEEMRRLR